MEEKLHQALLSIAHKILRIKDIKDIDGLRKQAQQVYEKLAMLAFIRQQQLYYPNDKTLQEDINNLETSLEAPPPTPKKEDTKKTTEATEQVAEIASKTTEEVPAKKVSNAEKTALETQPKEKVQGILPLEFEGTMPIEEGLKLFGMSSTPPTETTAKEEKRAKMVATAEEDKEAPTVVTDDQAPDFKELMRIDLNDRLAFKKFLFEDDMDAFLAFRNKLQKIKDFSSAKSFIKKNYAKKNNWAAHPDYSERLFNLVEQYFKN